MGRHESSTDKRNGRVSSLWKVITSQWYENLTFSNVHQNGGDPHVMILIESDWVPLLADVHTFARRRQVEETPTAES